MQTLKAGHKSAAPSCVYPSTLAAPPPFSSTVAAALCTGKRAITWKKKKTHPRIFLPFFSLFFFFFPSGGCDALNTPKLRVPDTDGGSCRRSPKFYRSFFSLTASPSCCRSFFIPPCMTPCSPTQPFSSSARRREGECVGTNMKTAESDEDGRKVPSVCGGHRVAEIKSAHTFKVCVPFQNDTGHILDIF